MNVADKTRRQLLEEIRVLRTQNANLERNSRQIPESGDVAPGTHSGKTITDRFIFIGIGLAVLFWILESGMETLFFHNGNFLYHLTQPDAHELWMRLVAGFIITFSFYAQIIQRKLKQAKVSLQQSSDKLEFRVTERTAELAKTTEKLQAEIAERKNAEEAVRKERDRAQKYLDVAGVMFVALDANGDVTLINNKGCEVLGYEEEDIIGKNWFNSFLPGRMKDDVVRVFNKLIAGEIEPVEYFENIVVTKSGAERTIAWHNTVLRDKQGSITATLGSGEDITERRQAEVALKESEDRYRRIVEDKIEDLAKFPSENPNPVLRITQDGKVLYVNPAGQSLLNEWGCEINQCVPDYWRQVVSDVLSSNSKKNVECEHKGRIISFEVTPIVKSGYANLYGRDITDRKKAEEEIKSERQRFFSLLENLPAYVYLQAPDYSIRFANRYFIEHFGNPEGRLCHKVLWDHEEPCKVCPTFRVLDTKESQVWEWAQAPDGRTYQIYDYPFIDSDGSLLVLELGIDITERKKAEKLLKEINQQLQISIDQMPTAYILWDTELHVLEWNKAAEEIFGYTREEMLGKNAVDYIVPDEITHLVSKALSELREGKSSSYSAKDNNIHKNGTLISCHWHNQPLTDDNGRLLAILTIAEDITERLIAQEKLHESEERFDLAVKGSNDGLWDWPDTNEEKQWWSAKSYELLGYEDGEIETSVSNLNSFLHPDDQDRMKEAIRAHFEDHAPYDVEYQLMTKLGEYRWFRVRGQALWDENGKPYRMSGSVRDISERKEAEEALRKSTNLLRESQEVARLGHYMFDIPTGSWESFDILDSIFGIGEDYPKNIDAWLQLVHRDQREEMSSYLSEVVLGQGQLFDREYRITRVSDQQVRWVHGLGRLEFDKEGKPTRMIGTIQDITNRKKAEEALYLSEEKFSKAFHFSPDAIAITSVCDGRLLEINEGFEEMFGYSRNEVIGKTTVDLNLWQSSKDRDAMLKEFKVNGRIKDLELHVRDKAGDIHDCLFSCELINIDSEPCLVSIARDITERKKAAEALRKAHDNLEFRVIERTAELAKTNEKMQIDITKRKKAEKKLIENQAHLRSLVSQLTMTEERERKEIAGLLHDDLIQRLVLCKMRVDKLGKSDILGESDCSLDEIGESIREMISGARSLTFDLCSPVLYDIGLKAAIRDWLNREVNGKYDITFEFADDSQQIKLSEDLRVFLYRAVRELCTNIIKHSKAQKATVSIRNKNGSAEIIVEDDGRGITIDGNMSDSNERGGLGLFGIRERLDHFGAGMNIESEADVGTRVTITVPLNL